MEIENLKSTVYAILIELLLMNPNDKIIKTLFYMIMIVCYFLIFIFIFYVAFRLRLVPLSKYFSLFIS